MQKTITCLIAIFIISSGIAYSAEENSASKASGITRAIFSKLLDTSVTKLNNVSNPAAGILVNNVKLVAYKKQLELKQQELKDVEESSTLGIIKWYRKRTINSKIEEIQKEINALETETTK